MTSTLPRRAGLEFLAEIGHGSSSTVWRARVVDGRRELPAGTEVAVKVLRKELLGDPAAVDRIRREGELGMRVDSPHVARIFAIDTDMGADGASVQLVMELVHGRTLRQLVADSGAVVEDLARRIGLDAVTGLVALHALGVVHRDLKPENLALTPEGKVVIVDLGLARDTGAAGTPGSAGTGGFVGSLAHAAPEVLRGEPATAASDLYALGTVLFEVVTGRHPFADATTADEMIHAHLTREPPRTSHLQPRVSAFLEQLIHDLLRKDVARRPPDAAAVAAALAAGERSEYWQQHEREAPVLASRQRLRSMRRFAATPFVGRREPRRELDRLARRVAGGRGAAVQISGPTGIGRRRLLDEAIEGWLRWRRDLVFVGGEPGDRATQQRGSPFVDVLLAWFLRGDAPDSPQVRSRLVSRMRHESALPARDVERLARLIAGEEIGEPPETRADLITRGVLEIAQPGRFVVLRVDRTEELSTTGRLVVARLLDRIETLPLLLVLVSGVGANAPRFAAQQMRLRGLAEDEFVDFGRMLFVADESPDALLRQGHRVLGGSPGNLLEALEALVVSGHLEGGPGRYHGLHDVAELRPSGPLLSRVRTRAAGLPAAQRFALIAAAVLGDRFPLADLAHLTGQHELELLEALSLFEGRVVAVERGQVTFRHRDFRRALLRLAVPAARRRLHRAAAWLVEDRGGSPLQIGLHLSRAALHEAAIDPLLDGLDRLTRGGSGRAAVRIAERVRLHLRAVPRSDDIAPRRLRYLLLAALAQRNAGRHPTARRRYQQAFRLAGRLGDPTTQARALLGLAELAAADGQVLAALHLLERAETLANDDDATAAHAYGLHARLLGRAGESRAALRMVRLGMRRLPADDPELRPRLQIELAELEALRTHFLVALKNLERAEQRLTDHDDTAGLLQAWLARGEIWLQLGIGTAARQQLDEALDLAVRLSDGHARGRALLALGDLEPNTAVALWVDALAAGDPVLRAEARLRLAAHGFSDRGLAEEVDALGLPALRARWLLLTRARTTEHAERAAIAAELNELEQNAMLPLGLRLQVLVAAGRRRRAETLMQEVAQRLSPMQRRAFLTRAEPLLQA